MDAPVVGALQRLTCGIDILQPGACQGDHHGTLECVADIPDRLEIARRGGREPSFYGVHTQFVELMGHEELFLGVHRATWRLLAIAQRGVENPDVDHFLRHGVPSLPGS